MSNRLRAVLPPRSLFGIHYVRNSGRGRGEEYIAPSNFLRAEFLRHASILENSQPDSYEAKRATGLIEGILQRVTKSSLESPNVVGTIKRLDNNVYYDAVDEQTRTRISAQLYLNDPNQNSL